MKKDIKKIQYRSVDTSQCRSNYETLLVTGVSGYYGQSLIKALQKNNPFKKIIGIDLKSPMVKLNKFTFYKMDIRKSSLKNIFEENNVDNVLHLAFALNVFMSERKIEDININGTLNLLNCAANNNTKKFVLASSTTVYGVNKNNTNQRFKSSKVQKIVGAGLAPAFNQRFCRDRTPCLSITSANKNNINQRFTPPENLYTEDMPLCQDTDLFYIKYKVIIENLVQEFKNKHKNIKFIILRPCLITGPSMNNILSQLLKLFLFIPSVKGLDPDMQFIHEDDLAKITLQAITSFMDGIYNVAPDTTIKYSEVIKLCRKFKLPISHNFLKAGAKIFEKIGLTAAFSGAVDLISYNWLVNNNKLKKNFDSNFMYTSREAFQSFSSIIRT